jgi:hypothetical protein
MALVAAEAVPTAAARMEGASPVLLRLAPQGLAADLLS